VEDDVQEVDSEEDYMPSSESESEAELARNVAPPPAKRPLRDIATASSSSDSSIYIPTKNILKGKNGYKWSSYRFITCKTKERNIVHQYQAQNGKLSIHLHHWKHGDCFFLKKLYLIYVNLLTKK
jgi:hypothetical protein